MFDEIANLVKTLYSIHPELRSVLRFQQLMSIAATKGGWNVDDLFYCPDEVIVAGLKKCIQDGM